MTNIKLLFIVLDEGHHKKVNFLLSRFGVSFKTISNARGTASQSLLDYFGLAETEKDVYLAVIPEYLEQRMLEKINSDFSFDKHGSGIAFTISIASSNKFLSDNFVKSVYEVSERGINMDNTKYHLILTIVMEGYLNQVMTAAKRVGASGGTVIKGRGLANLNPGKILGFNIEPERDIVLTIVEEGMKNKVMEEITKEVGIKTPGRGVCISLPIDSAVGLTEKN